MSWKNTFINPYILTSIIKAGVSEELTQTKTLTNLFILCKQKLLKRKIRKTTKKTRYTI